MIFKGYSGVLLVTVQPASKLTDLDWGGEVSPETQPRMWASPVRPKPQLRGGRRRGPKGPFPDRISPCPADS